MEVLLEGFSNNENSKYPKVSMLFVERKSVSL